MSPTTDAIWLADPGGDADFRLWRDDAWTDDVLIDGVHQQSPRRAMTRPPVLSDHERSIRHQVQHEARVHPSARGPVSFDEARVLVVNGVMNGHGVAGVRVFDDAGRRLGFASPSGMPRRPGVGAAVLDALRPMAPEVGRLLQLTLTDGSNRRLERSSWPTGDVVQISGDDGALIGQIGRRAGFLRRPSLEISRGHEVVATMQELDRRARRWSIRDASDAEIGRVEKTPSTDPSLLRTDLRFVVERRSAPGTAVDALIGLVPFALTLIFHETYDLEAQMDLTRPRSGRGPDR